MDNKICKCCNKEKNITEYSKLKNRLNTICYECKNKKQKEYHEKKSINNISLDTAKNNFELLFETSDIKLQCIEWNCQYPYVISITENIWIPITLRTCDAESRYGHLNIPTKGLVICWKSGEEIAYFDTNNWSNARCVFSSLKKLAISTVSAANLLESIKLYVETSTIKTYNIENIKNCLRVERIKQDTMDIEHKFTSWLLKNYNNIIKRCYEGCLADVYIAIDNNEMVLPLQLKASEMIPRSGDFAFKVRHKYNGMIVCLRHVTYNNGTFVVPGNNIPETSMGGTWTGKYGKYLIADDMLNEFLVSLYYAVKKEEKYICYPSGDNINIEMLTLKNKNDVVIPITKLGKFEREYAEHRESKLPFLEYKYPDKDGCVYDIIINGKKIQDKIAGVRKNNYTLLLCKSNGRKNKKIPYCQGDFDYLYIHTPNKKSFYLIPSTVLVEHGFMSSNNNQTKISLCWYPNKESYANSWVNQYLLHYDTLLEEDIISKLQNIKIEN